jgi:TetR/AcrR family transcriptional regulator, regulator of mycofactocin system
MRHRVPPSRHERSVPAPPFGRGALAPCAVATPVGHPPPVPLLPNPAPARHAGRVPHSPAPATPPRSPATPPVPRGPSRASARRLPVARRLEDAALELFATRGFEATTVDDLAAAGGVGRRTFFRYFPTKLDVVLGELDEQRDALAAALAERAGDPDPVSAARRAFLAVNRYAIEDLPGLRRRLRLLADVPDLEARATVRYRDWERLLAADAARRWDVPPSALRPQVLARAEVAAMRGVFAVWVAEPGVELEPLVTEAFDALATGFAP